MIKINKPSKEAYEKAKKRWDSIAKPLDGMGRFEEIISGIAAIQNTTDVSIDKKCVLVMCADNGIVAENISQSGQEVTAVCAKKMAEGTTSVCRMAQKIGADIIPVDIGIVSEVNQKGVLQKNVRRGTRNFALEPAMTAEECRKAINTGIALVKEYAQKGYNMIATGEMGIGNTTTSSAVAAALTGLEVSEVTGRGAGLDDDRLRNKIAVIEKAIDKYSLRSADAMKILQCVGGLDIAGLVGVCIGGAEAGVPIVLDGIIADVAALTAERIAPGVKDYLIPSHIGKEPAAIHLNRLLGFEPVIHANMALGEGTGAVVMMGMLDIAMTVYDSCELFDDIAVDQYERF